MIVPRDYAGQRQLWEQLNGIFGGNGTCPEPPPPEPCVQDWKQLKWTSVIAFRQSFDNLIRLGSLWGGTGMEPNTWYMYIDRQIKCIQIVRTIAFNKDDPTIEVPGRDGWWMYDLRDVPVVKGLAPGELVCHEGVPARYWMTLFISDAYLTMDYAVVSISDPPLFSSMVGSHSCPLDELTEVYLSLWNWGYSQYRPEMDTEVRITVFTEGDYVPGSERPKVVNL